MDDEDHWPLTVHTTSGSKHFMTFESEEDRAAFVHEVVGVGGSRVITAAESRDAREE